jgi:DNA-binding NtrC family response regulator
MLPPLRERGKDIGMLAQYFLDQLNATHRTQKVFAPGAAASLEQQPWPGNVRELKNFVERAFILADRTLEGAPQPGTPAGDSRNATTVSVPVGASLAEADRRLILATLEHCGGVKKWAAELLGISLKTLYNRLEEYRARAPRAPLPHAGNDGIGRLARPPPRRAGMP